jgi:hypothetical protein
MGLILSNDGYLLHFVHGSNLEELNKVDLFESLSKKSRVRSV